VGLGQLKKGPASKKVETVLGVDASTNSLAFCLYGKDGPIRWGEIKFNGSTVFERLSDGQNRVRGIAHILKADLIVFESAVYVQNKKTVILLAYAFGAIVAALMATGARVEEISPMTWQNAIGNKALTKAEKQKIVDANPGKSKSWYSNANREFRKARTMAWVEKAYGIKVDSDNVSDAIAVASVGHSKFSDTTT